MVSTNDDLFKTLEESVPNFPTTEKVPMTIKELDTLLEVWRESLQFRMKYAPFAETELHLKPEFAMEIQNLLTPVYRGLVDRIYGIPIVVDVTIQGDWAFTTVQRNA